MAQYNPKIHVACCPECDKTMSSKHNRRKDKTWKCYYCNKIVQPKIREKKTMYQQDNKKKPTPNKDIMTEKDLLNILNKYCKDYYWMKKKDIRNVAMIATLYLTGARISELIGIRKFEKVTEEGKIKIIWNREYKVEPLKAEQINFSTEYGVPIIEFINLPILKRYDEMIKNNKNDYKLIDHYPRRTIQIPVEHNKNMIEFIQRFKNTIYNDQQYLFEISHQRAWKICKEITYKHPHFFRHCRVSDLIKIYNFKDNQLQHFIGWSSSLMASKYSHLHSSDLLRSMVTNWDAKKEQILNL